MPFLTRLAVALIDDSANEGRGSWQHLEPLTFHSNCLNRDFTAPAGSITDFASVPRIPGIFDVYGDRAHRAAALHDHLYGSHEVDRATADGVFLEAMLDTGVPPDIAQVMYDGVRQFGGSHWDTHSQNAPVSPSPIDGAA
jgi:hypothetical protein